MKRLITTLVILLVVMVVGMTALVMLVNPNNFRAYMICQVEQRSGYQLALNGKLRWHVWPQLSILSGPITLTAPGAAQPIVHADNMRLDVNLLPLLSHQLSVKQVMLKGVVVRLTPDSESQRPADAPIGLASDNSALLVDEVTRGWRFDISRLRINDSLLVWQQNNGEQLNLRDFNLAFDQTQLRQAHIEFRSRINRNQRELQLHFNADLDISDYPKHLSALVNQLDYQMKGADLPQEGIKGEGQMKARWAAAAQRFDLRDFSLSANDSMLAGTLSGTLGQRPQLLADLHSPSLNLDSLFGFVADAQKSTTGSEQLSGRGPVISSMPESDNADSVLNAMDGELILTVDQLRWRGMLFSKVGAHGVSKDGLLTMDNFKGQSENGSFSLPGTVDVRTATTRVTLTPELHQINLPPLLKSFAMPDTVSGVLSLNGNFTGSGLSVDAFKRQWRGKAQLRVDNAQFAGLNFQQLIQRAVENSSKVHGQGDENTPNLQSITGSATLNNGVIDFGTLDARSNVLNYTGAGSVDLVKRALDVRFCVTVTAGWSGDDTLVKRLHQPVPLRIYGPWSAINYNLKDDVLRQQLRDEARQRLKEWISRNPE
ncbi:asmA-like C-terminal region family protein [Candidatus Erwinia dacicola]|uniref:AsmA-like C-terminal region family protein n=1 Tax=Candidatus Erwinia dacicola TaxID=252393 RepID=A0A328TTN6_9GAMM|nr:outer membrane assembly protein AsmA [Candidatus Erwinia dacicola]RAP71196.1 asmA-like C-terminal region family protein [Candidatus Erwinia dacicola]